MKTAKLLIAGLSALTWLTIGASGQIIKSENFDSEDSAKTNGWVELGSRANNMDYGYSPGTQFAGGAAPGEAGGKVGRDQIRSMYADVFGSFLTLDTPLVATGRLGIAFQNGNAAVVIGHSDSTLIGQNQDSRSAIGIRTVPSARQLEAVIGLTNAVRTSLVVNGDLDVTGLTNYLWSYSWDPNGGTSGAGALTVTVSDSFNGESSFTNTVTLSLSVADRNQNPRFDSFGLTTRTLGATAVFAQTYVDDVAYTALPSCVRVAPSSATLVPGQTNKTITVSIPTSANIFNDVHVVVTSSNPAVAEPTGAVAGSLALVFPAGGDNSQTFSISGVSAGDTVLNFSSTNAICFADDQVSVTVVPTADTVVKTQTFDTSTAARANGWSELGSRANGQNFGFSATGNAGPAGEAGGDFKRDPARAIYADIFGGKLTLNDVLRASGTIIIPSTPVTNAGPVIGHINSAQVGQSSEANSLGLMVTYTTSGILEFRLRLVLANGTGYEPTGLLSPAAESTLYYWDYLYDPTGGPEGNGTLTVNISDGVSFITNTAVLTLTASDRAIGAEFDGFGLATRSLAASPAGTSAFVDNVEYTAIAEAPCVRFLGATTLISVVGQTNKLVTVAIPAAANAGGSFNVTVQSQNPAVAVPAGASESGVLVLTFPADGELIQSFTCNALAPGETTFTLSHGGAAFCTGGAVTVSVLPTAVTQTKTETFDTASSAADHGWVELGSRLNGQDFGFSDTANAGGPGGEAGGIFKRDSIRSAYVDVFGGKLTLNDYFSASGKLIIPGAHTGNLGPIFGHSDSTRAGQNSATSGQVVEANNVGLVIVSGTTFVLEFILADGNRVGEINLPGTIATDTVYDWSYVYDPTGGPSGNGSFTVNVSANDVTNSAVFNLAASHRAVGAEFDCFGVTSRALASSTATGPAFMDNVSYSVPAAPGGPLRIASIEVVGENLRLTIDTPSTGSTHEVLEATALDAAFTGVTGVNFSVQNNQLVAEFPKPASTRFYRVVIP